MTGRINQLMARTPFSAAALFFTVCFLEAQAQHSDIVQADIDQEAPLTSETKIRTMAECRVLVDRTEKIACMTEARNAQQALRDVQHAAKLAALDRQLANEREESRELESTIGGFAKTLEIAERLEAEGEQQDQ